LPVFEYEFMAILAFFATYGNFFNHLRAPVAALARAWKSGPFFE